MVNLALKYRPRRFEEVHGQETPVRLLSQLIKAGQVGRSILLYGSVGSGKTTLARLYARALNCDDPDPEMGSPCNSCDACRNFDGDSLFHEYDASREGGDIDRVRLLLDHWNQSPPNPKSRRILFFDEAHSITASGFDALLKAVEEPEDEVFFIFATSELAKVPKSLTSRLHMLELRPLTADEAITFLEAVARAEGIPFENEGLALLAGLKEGYPRDLLIGLDQVSALGDVTVHNVRVTFSGGHTDTLVSYFSALAEGDLGSQTKIMFLWRDPLRDKVRWLQLFLLSVYHNEILGVPLTVDAWIASIPLVDRSTVVAAFQRRLGLSSPSELAPFWRQMMDFWPLIPPHADDAALLLRLTLFHAFVAKHEVHNALVVECRQIEPAPTHQNVADGRRAQRPISGSSRRVTPRLSKAPNDPAYLSKKQVGQIINAASFLMQDRGVCFNARIIVRPGRRGTTNERRAVDEIIDFQRQLSGRVEAWTKSDLNRWTVFETHELHGLYCVIAAHLPSGCVPNVKRWLDEWARACGGTVGPEQAFELSLASTKGPHDLKFHWRTVLDLCGGLNPAEMGWDRETETHRPLQDLLKLPRKVRRKAGRLIGRRMSSSDSLGPSEIAKACINKMSPLSVFDSQEWTWLQRGWEIDEYQERLRHKHKWQQMMTEIALKYPTAGPDRDAAFKAHLETWPSDPEARPRGWQGWWSKKQG